jgi:hypothetical protein
MRPNMNDENELNVHRVLVLGGGSAGLLVALASATRAPNVQTAVVRSTKMGVIGVGEGTIASIGRLRHEFLNIDPCRFDDHRPWAPASSEGTSYGPVRERGPVPDGRCTGVVVHHPRSAQTTSPCMTGAFEARRAGLEPTASSNASGDRIDPLRHR